MSIATARRVGLTGNEAVALAWRQIDPDVVAAYPITPSTQIVERFSQDVADGAVRTQFIPAESEHSAISACVGASAAGARVVTATSSQGLALMHEILYVASGLRLPIVMAVATRALSAPLNIHGDHSDVMGSRDAGWIQLFASSVQEAYDLTILAVRVAERARLPVMVCLDGFTLSHTLEPLEISPDAEVRAFVGERDASEGYALLGSAPIAVGALALPDAYMDFRKAQARAMDEALTVIAEETAAFNARFQRTLPALLETRDMRDARTAVVMMGSHADLVAEAIQGWRKDGKHVGLVRLTTFRPFPERALAGALASVHSVLVMERADSLSTLGGPLGIEVRAALYPGGPGVTGVIFGLGGRELRDADLARVRDLLDLGSIGGTHYLGVGDGA